MIHSLKTAIRLLEIQMLAPLSYIIFFTTYYLGVQFLDRVFSMAYEVTIQGFA